VIITIFRARVRLEAHDEYVRLAARMGELARQVPGYVSHKCFIADDGERVMIVEFESERAQRIWSERREHMEAKHKGRASFYVQYRVQVCTVQRESSFPSRVPLAALG
jgi:heme-degrading monooxygenase HmoA